MVEPTCSMWFRYICFSSNLTLSLLELIILGFQASRHFSYMAIPRNDTESPAYGAAVNMLGHGLEAVGTQLGGDRRVEIANYFSQRETGSYWI